MSEINYQKMEETLQVLIDKNEKLVEMAKEAMKKRNDVFVISGQLNAENLAMLDFQVECIPDGSIVLIGFFRLPELKESLIQVVCTAQLEKETGEIVVEENLMFVLGEKTSESLNPLSGTAKLVTVLIENLYQTEQVLKPVRLSGNALDELMLIQQEVLFKERDGKGLTQLEFDYRQLKG